MINSKISRISVLYSAICLVLALLFLAPVPAEAAKYELFGTKEIRSKKLTKFKKWTEAIARYETEKPSELKKCTVTATQKCHLAKWRIFLNQIKEQPRGKQLALVNQFLNKWLYILDPVNYNKKDYWATPTQFMQRSGDCEDYAIAKYLSLLHLGWSKDDMRIVVLQDLNLNIPHAILTVYAGGKAWILDNQIQQVIEANRVKHYKPIFSINESYWWLHRG